MSDERYFVVFGELQGETIWSAVSEKDNPTYLCISQREKSKEICEKIAKLLNESSEKGQSK